MNYQFKDLLNRVVQLKEATETLNNPNQRKKKPSKTLNIMTLFSGMGAPELALEQLGFKHRILLACDNEDAAEKIWMKLHSRRLVKGRSEERRVGKEC